MGRELVCKGGNDHVCRALFLHLFPSVLNLRTRLESTSAVGELRCVMGRELVCNGSNDHTCDELFLHLFPSVANFRTRLESSSAVRPTGCMMAPAVLHGVELGSLVSSEK